MTDRLLRTLDGLTARWWFGDAVVFALSVGILTLAMVLTPSTEAVSLLGFDVPVLCGFRMVTGYGCPGCGLTRSFVFLGHGQLWEAFQMNWFGPPLFGLLLVQLPFRVIRLVTGPRQSAARTERDAA